MTPRLKVAIVLAVLFGGVILYALLAPHARADVPPELPAHDPSLTVAAGSLLIAGMAAFCLLCIGVFYAGLWLQRKWRPYQAGMDALIEATHECPPDGPCPWCVSRAPDLTPEGRAALEANKQRSIATGDHHCPPGCAVCEAVTNSPNLQRVEAAYRKARIEQLEELWALPVVEEPETKR